MASAMIDLSQSQLVLRNLLHLVSQPLTTLHCALESSLAEEQAESADEVVQALEQTDRVIEGVRLMREYLEAEEGCSSKAAVALGPAVGSVLEELCILAETRGLHLYSCGEAKGTIRMGEAWLRRALVYLLGALIESDAPGRAIALLLEETMGEYVISGHSLPVAASATTHRSVAVVNTLLQARLAIARRAFESSGATLELCYGEKPGFTVRIPKAEIAANDFSI